MSGIFSNVKKKAIDIHSGITDLFCKTDFKVFLSIFFIILILSIIYTVITLFYSNFKKINYDCTVSNGSNAYITLDTINSSLLGGIIFLGLLFGVVLIAVFIFILKEFSKNSTQRVTALLIISIILLFILVLIFGTTTYFANSLSQSLAGGQIINNVDITQANINTFINNLKTASIITGVLSLVFLATIIGCAIYLRQHAKNAFDIVKTKLNLNQKPVNLPELTESINLPKSD